MDDHARIDCIGWVQGAASTVASGAIVPTSPSPSPSPASTLGGSDRRGVPGGCAHVCIWVDTVEFRALNEGWKGAAAWMPCSDREP